MSRASLLVVFALAGLAGTFALAGLAGTGGALAQEPPPGPGHPHHPPHHGPPPAALTVDDYLNCVRGCSQIFGATEASEAALECIRGCRFTSSRESLPPEPAPQQ